MRALFNGLGPAASGTGRVVDLVAASAALLLAAPPANAQNKGASAIMALYELIQTGKRSYFE